MKKLLLLNQKIKQNEWIDSRSRMKCKFYYSENLTFTHSLSKFPSEAD